MISTEDRIRLREGTRIWYSAQQDNRILIPSKTNDRVWIRIVLNNSYPEPTSKSGKWLIFGTQKETDDYWNKVKKALIENKLGNDAKVATSCKKPEYGKDSKVICVYTYNYEDTKDTMRIREALRDIGFIWNLPYKSDEDTISGIYTRNGNHNFRKYYC